MSIVSNPIVRLCSFHFPPIVTYIQFLILIFGDVLGEKNIVHNSLITDLRFVKFSTKLVKTLSKGEENCLEVTT